MGKCLFSKWCWVNGNADGKNKSCPIRITLNICFQRCCKSECEKKTPLENTHRLLKQDTRCVYCDKGWYISTLKSGNCVHPKTPERGKSQTTEWEEKLDDKGLQTQQGKSKLLLLLLLLSRFSRVRLCATPKMAAHQAPPSLGFSRQEHWSGLPFPSPVHESEKWNRTPVILKVYRMLRNCEKS